MAKGRIRNATSMGRGANTAPVNVVAYTEAHPADRGARSTSSRISRVGSTAKKTFSGSGGDTF